MDETIPLQILDPFTGFFEVGHTCSAQGQNAQRSQLVSRIRPCEAPSRCVILLTVNEGLPLHQDHLFMRRRGAASAKQGYGHDEQRTTNNEQRTTSMRSL